MDPSAEPTVAGTMVFGEVSLLPFITTFLRESHNLTCAVVKKFVTNTEEIRKNFEVLVQISKYHAK